VLISYEAHRLAVENNLRAELEPAVFGNETQVKSNYKSNKSSEEC
jgi:hypothetical protein